MLCKHENKSRVILSSNTDYSRKDILNSIKDRNIEIVLNTDTSTQFIDRFKFYKNDTISLFIEVNYIDSTISGSNLKYSRTKFPSICEALKSNDSIYIDLLKHYFHEQQQFYNSLYFQSTYKPDRLDEQFNIDSISYLKGHSLNYYCEGYSIDTKTDSCIIDIPKTNNKKISDLIYILNNKTCKDQSWCFVPDCKIDFFTESNTLFMTMEYVSSCSIFLINKGNQSYRGAIYNQKDQIRFTELLIDLGAPKHLMESLKFTIATEEKADKDYEDYLKIIEPQRKAKKAYIEKLIDTYNK